MTILLMHPETAVRDMIAFCLAGELGAQVHATSNFQEAVEHFIGEAEIHLVVTTTQGDADKLFKYILSTGSEVFIVLIEPELNKTTETYPDLKIMARVHKSEVVGKLLSILKDQFRKILDGTQSPEYCRIAPALLMRVAPLKGDVFIRLSSVKYVKLFKTGSTFTKDDFERVTEKKKLSALYIKKTETREFIQKFHLDLQSIVEEALAASTGAPDPTLLDTAMEVQEVVQELAGRLGFTREVREIAQQNVKLTMLAIGHSPRLKDAMSAPHMRHRNYVSSHSIMLAHLTCSIAAQMDWPSDTTFHKLVLASLFHDYDLQDPSMAKIISKTQLDADPSAWTQEQQEKIVNHSYRAAEMVRTFKEMPADVDTILLQHHERPDGSGFPVGLRSQQIAPLASVFIVAHDIIDALVQKKNQFSFEDFLKEHEAEYQMGTFRKIWKVLSNAEDLDDLDTDTNSSDSAA